MHGAKKEEGRATSSGVSGKLVDHDGGVSRAFEV